MTDFQAFWRTVNSLLQSLGQPELLYGEARDLFEDYQARKSLAA
jgi:hypothetical protein